MEQEVIAVPKNVLKAVFEEQVVLIKYYSMVEGLPEAPLNLALKKSQSLIRDFAGRFTEELSEAYTELEKAYLAISDNKVEEAQKFVMAYNEEIGDALHFLVELFIFAGIWADDIELKFKNFLFKQELDTFHYEGRPLKSILEYNYYKFNVEINSLKLSPSNFPVFTEAYPHIGGRKLSENLLDEHAKLLWKTTTYLYKALNSLKNKQWHTGEHEKWDDIEFKEGLLETFIWFVLYLDIAFVNESTFYKMYLMANKKNKLRIQKGH